MKTSLKLAAALPALALISACSTTGSDMATPTTSETVTEPTEMAQPEATDPAPTTPAPTTPESAPTSTSEDTTDVAYDRMAPAPYTCTDDSEILAKQSINKTQATITATIPKINWSQQTVILNGGVEGETASYVNDSNPEVIYAWHMQGDEGVFAMKWTDGQEYQVDCTL